MDRTSGASRPDASPARLPSKAGSARSSTFLDVIPALERAIDRIWSFHFRLFWPAWLAIGVALGAVAIFVPLDQVRFVAGILAILCFAGVFRWRRARRRCRGALLLVPKFYTGTDAGGRAEEAQRIVIDTLRQHLPIDQREVVQPVEVVIGSDEQHFAEKTRRRLRCLFVLHGRVAARTDGGWSVFPRLLEPAHFRDRGMKALLAEEWGRAYVWFDWIAIVGRRDLQEAWARTFAAVCLWRDDRPGEGELAWDSALEEFGPISLLARASIAGILKENGIDSTVPGDEPTENADVIAEIDRRWPDFRNGPNPTP